MVDEAKLEHLEKSFAELKAQFAEVERDNANIVQYCKVLRSKLEQVETTVQFLSSWIKNLHDSQTDISEISQLLGDLRFPQADEVKGLLDSIKERQ